MSAYTKVINLIEFNIKKNNTWMQIHINCHIIIIQPNVLMIISLKHLEISYDINDLTQLLDQLI